MELHAIFLELSGLVKAVSHDSLINLLIANRKKLIMVGIKLFLVHFEQIMNSKAK